MLRTKVLLTMRRNGWKRLAVTSPTAGCGKTTTACNLAIGNARNQDIQTILIEFDLRRPSISKSLKMPVTVDLEEMLDRKVDFAEQALRYCSNIAICAAQKPSKDPSTILLSKSTQEVLREIEERYDPDCMIFDLPPLLVNDDTRVVLKDVDCALMVVQAGITTVAQIDACEREIAEHTNMIGVVLNQCRDSDEVYDDYE